MVMASVLRAFTVVAASSRYSRACTELRQRIPTFYKESNRPTISLVERQSTRPWSCSAGYSVINEDSRSAHIENDKKLVQSSISQSFEDTIAAIVTSLGGREGSVAIVRLSGSEAVAITRRHFRPARNSSSKGTLFSKRDNWQPRSHYVQYGALVDVSGSVVDEVLVVPMLGPRSYTREDVVELQCHGGDICVRRILQICLESGARLAQPGEFTLRAFLNGRLDLPQAESVAQLVSARSSVAAKTALAGMQGGFSSLVQAVRQECLELLGDIEARLDFEDEMPILEQEEVVDRIQAVWERLQEALATARRGELLDAGLQVAIVGRPNVGKSSLLNAWSQSNRAIVTDIPGTTRDVVESSIVAGGISLKLLDTAGIRDTADIVESIGVERSVAAAAGADVIVMVMSACDGWTTEDDHIFRILWGKPMTGDNGASLSACAHEKSKMDLPRAHAILVANKVDIALAPLDLPDYVMRAFATTVSTCALQRVGLGELETALLQEVGMSGMSTEGQQWAVNQRQAEQLVRAGEAMQRVKDSAQADVPLDMWTVDLKEAVIALGQITGDEVTEEILSSIFSRFCIGK